jgi:drug/metabolite transporter (DMT)-like permease
VNRHQVTGRRTLGLLLALFTALIWGTLPVILKVLVQWVEVYTLAWARLLVAGMLLAPLLLMRYGWRSVLQVCHMPWLMLICIVGLCGNYVTYMSSLHFVSPGAAQVVIQLAPMFVLLGGMLIFGEKFNSRQWWGLLVLIIGMLLFFNLRYADLLQSVYGGGILMVVLAAIFWASYIMAQKQMQSTLPPEVVLFVIYVSSVFILSPMSQPLALLSLTYGQMGLVVLSAALTVVSYVSFGIAMNHLEASRTGIVVALTPLITMGNAYFAATFLTDLILPEPLNGLSIMGAVLVVFGSALGTLGGTVSKR